MNKLDYSIALREKGLSTNDIRRKMKANGFEESQIEYYLKKSDEIFLNQSVHSKRYKSKRKPNTGIKMLTLVLSLILLSGVFFGYARIGLLGLFVIWSLIGYSSYRNY